MSDTGEQKLKRVGVMGGTFDPIHIGHLVAASVVLRPFDLDRILFVPAGDPWQKRSESPAEDRFLMTSLAIAGHPAFAASRLELDRSGPTYTADTFEALRSFYGPEVELYLIMGADSLLNLSTWEKLDRLREVAEIIAVTRPGFDMSAYKDSEALPKVHVHEMPGIDISATDIRDRVRRGDPIDFMVPVPVIEYIRERGLYAPGVTERSA